MKLAALIAKLLSAAAFGSAAVLVVGSGAAVGKSDSPSRHSPAYRTHGHSSIYARNDQVCFAATWTGSGSWTTSYSSSSENGLPSTVLSDKDSWGFSWNLSEYYAGAACPLIILAGKVGSVGTTFNRGHVQDNATLNDTETITVSGAPPTTTTYTCNPGASSKTKVEGLMGSFGGTVRHSSIVFQGNALAGPTGCPAGTQELSAPGDTGPGSAASGGKPVINFFEKDSPAVPVSVFEHAKSVSIPFGRTFDEPANCGITPDPQLKITCMQSGSWQGTLTLTAVG